MENLISKELEEKIANAETLDEVVSICNDAGIQVTKEELERASKAGGELGEDDLDNVGGGLFVIGGAVAAAIIWGIYRAKKS